VGGGEEDEEEGDFAVGDGGVAVEAEEFLHADFQRRAIFGGVVDGQVTA
jgi:hypothetical protein